MEVRQLVLLRPPTSKLPSLLLLPSTRLNLVQHYPHMTGGMRRILHLSHVVLPGFLEANSYSSCL